MSGGLARDVGDLRGHPWGTLSERVNAMKNIGVYLSMFLLSVGFGYPALAQTAPVPSVRCVSDGQMGPTLAPMTSQSLWIPVASASRLAWYVSDRLAVLAPRGWKCVGLYGSNGSTLMVVPDDPRGLVSGRDSHINGQGIQLSKWYGDTSGRFEAARIAARLFPNRQAFVDAVANEGIVPKEEFRNVPFPDDRIQRLGADQVSFETPANKDGLGTMSRLMKSRDPIEGMVKMNGSNDATLLVVRLKSTQRDLAPTILLLNR
jgi:hypothetical protein